MKKLLFVLYAGIIALSGCNDTVTETVTYMVNEPVFMSTKVFRESVNVTATPKTISNYGKMCFYEGYMYISETGEGIHIVDNRNPSDPKNVGFIELLGNADLAIRNGKLYADSYIDLVWFNITDPARPELDGRLENVFPTVLPIPENNYGIDPDYCYGCNSGDQEIVVGWQLKQKTQIYTYETGGWWGNTGRDDAYYIANDISLSGVSNGVNGSMSRFALYKDYLYTVVNYYMDVFDLSGTNPMKVVENLYVGNVETIFSYKDNMFMGMPTGMTIYSVTNPLKPERQSTVWHVFGCDPVVVENDIAYVTIHSGNACGQTNDDLIIYDVSNVKSPRHIVTYAMKNPKGLGIDNNTLFLCDDGLKIFNASDPQTLMANRLAHYSGMNGFDVIPFNNVLMMIADDGFYQYDYSDLNAIRQLSKLSVVKK